MIGPEIVIRFEHRHIRCFDREKGRQPKVQLVFEEASGIRAWREHRRPPFYGYGFDSMEVKEGALLELNQLGPVGCAAFREDVKNRHLTSLVLELPFLNGAHRGSCRFSVRPSVNKLALDALGDLSDTWDFLNCFFGNKRGRLKPKHHHDVQPRSMIRHLNPSTLPTSAPLGPQPL